jgi:hypothetical protein
LKKVIVLLGITVFVLAFFSTSHAGLPFNTTEGVGGVTFNPLAYTAGSPIEKDKSNTGFSYQDVLSKPQFGGWYANLGGQTGVKLTTMGVAETLFNRLELSYGYESLGNDLGLSPNVQNNYGAKLLLLPENFNGLKFLPAISVGTIYKQTSRVTLAPNNSSWDYYIVGTKLITQLPLPVLLSAGGLSTQGLATGLLGYDHDRDTIFFGNFDIIPVKQVAIGFEYKQGASYSDTGLKNADIWSIHAAWFATKDLTLIAAYANAGKTTALSNGTIGLGDGFTVSAQYHF